MRENEETTFTDDLEWVACAMRLNWFNALIDASVRLLFPRVSAEMNNGNDLNEMFSSFCFFFL